MKMKLLFIIENPKFIGGGDYSIFKYAEYLAKVGHKIIIFAKNKNKFFENYELPKNMKIYYRGSFKKYFKGYEILNKLYENIYNIFVLYPFIKKNNDFDFVIGYLREAAIKAVKIGKRFIKYYYNYYSHFILALCYFLEI